MVTLSYDKCSPAYRSFCLNASAILEPTTYTQASKLDCWRKAMHAEITALEQNHTWTLVDLPPRKHPIGCKWVYKVKYNVGGTIERYKARLVAKGYTQVEGVDYFDTFSPVAKLTSVKVLLAIAAAKCWFLEQLDVNNAFLHGDLHEEVYMKFPPGMSFSTPNQICKLEKSLYGLKQASSKWYSKLSNALISLNYMQSTTDYCLFTKAEGSSFTAILVYVDDLVLAGNNLEEIQHVKQFFDRQFKIKDLGQLRFFLGFEVSRSQSGIVINQRKYTLELLSDVGLLASKPVSTPMNPSNKHSHDEGTAYSDPSSYRQLIGRLLYLTNTRPDICFAVQQLSEHVSNPMEHHYRAATHILKYLKSSPAKGVFYPSTSDLKLSAFADSDWASCAITRKSIT